MCTTINSSDTYHFLYSLFAVHESSGDGIGCEDLISLSELLEEDSVGETLAADSDALQDTIASQLLQHQGRVYFTSLQLEKQNH